MNSRTLSRLIDWLFVALLAFAGVSCSDESNTLTGPSDADDETNDQYTMERTLSEGAQRNTIAFDGLAFLSGDLGGQSFLPPGKVADFSGFQYLRDNDPTQLGHNTDFVTIVAFNVLHRLSESQISLLVERAKNQVDLINEYAYKRFPLMKAFRRLVDEDFPSGASGLDKSAVMAYSAEIYRIDGQISYDRAQLLGGIARSFSASQRAALDSLKSKGGVGNWDRTLADPLQDLHLDRDVSVAVMTYASEMYSWYAGSINADTYFCPERQGTYFGSFYLKDWPAMGNPNYTIDEQLTASAGESFLRILTPAQAAQITGIVEAQKTALANLVEKRRSIATQLRRFMTDSSIDNGLVMSLSEQYGQLDGEICYLYATRFSQVYATLSVSQKDQITALADSLGYVPASGAFLYSQPIAMPEIINTDFLFSARGSSDFELGSPDVQQGGALPVEYTCDGTAATLPLEWTNAPEGTQSYALIMHHEASATEIHWYWIVYDIPATIDGISKNGAGPWTLGNNSVNGMTEYAPPCSKGPGTKTYIYTLYALSAQVEIAVDPFLVNRDVLLGAMDGKILATAGLAVTYSR